MGTPPFATNVFKTLINNNYDIVALYTQPDKKVGRKQLLTYPHIKQYCVNSNINIKIYQPLDLKDSLFDINSLKPDFIVVVAYGQILPQNILSIAPCINLHASILPLYRGAIPIQQAVLNDDKYTGVTAMLMEAGLDSGDMLSCHYIKIDDKNSVELFDKLSLIASDLIVYVLNNFVRIKPKKQLQTSATYCAKITKQHGKISFENSFDIYNKFKAYKGWPGIFTKNGLKIISCDIDDKNTKNKKAKIVDIQKQYIKVACTNGVLTIYEVQPIGKKPMNCADYCRGKRLKEGDIFE